MNHSHNLIISSYIFFLFVIITPFFLKGQNDYLKPYINLIKEEGYTIKIDDRLNFKPGYKFNEHEVKGVPIRLAVGNRDIENNSIEVFRRDLLLKENINIENLLDKIEFLIRDIQEKLLNKAKAFQLNNTKEVENYNDFKKLIEKGGFVLAHWDGSEETELKIKNETKATIRCIPESNSKTGTCIISGKKSLKKVYFAKSY